MRRNGGPAQKRERVAVEAFPILGQTTAAVEPCDGPLDDPSLGQDGEAFGHVRSFDDLHLDLAQGATQAGVAAIGVEPEQEGVEPEEAGHQQHASVAVLDVGRMHDGAQQQALRVYQDVALLALDLLARIIPVPVDAGPPFSALPTLWLSMVAAVGLASRPAFSRHWTSRAWRMRSRARSASQRAK